MAIALICGVPPECDRCHLLDAAAIIDQPNKGKVQLCAKCVGALVERGLENDNRMVVLKLDGEVWECAPGFDTDENSIGNVRRINPKSKDPADQRALDRGITHRQHTAWGNVDCHEVRKLGEVGDGKTY